MKRTALAALLTAALPLLAQTTPRDASGSIGRIERFDPALDALIPPDAQMEKLAEGFDWSEGPVWRRRERDLLFSDVPQNVVYRWQEGAGLSEYQRPSGFTGGSRDGESGSNGLTVDRRGNLILAQHGDRRVARLEADRSFTTLADRWDGKRFNSPNDLALVRQTCLWGLCTTGYDLFFTDPPYGLEKGMEDPLKELPFQGVYRLTRRGELRLQLRDLSRPNGVTVSPDRKTVYVAISDPAMPLVMAYSISRSGDLTDGRIFFDTRPLMPGRKGLPDGLKTDRAGNVWTTGPGGVLVISPQGRLLGLLNTGEATANCAWGDDGSTLYITADMYLCRIRTTARGILP
ncbi:MAG: SMP-30/gluconolactonase/LRE family protein [Limisphaerales bacterium]